MKQFDVCPVVGAASTKSTRLVLILQHSHVDILDTIIVAPLYSPKELPMLTRLRLMVRVGRRSHVVAVDRMAALAGKQLGPPVTNLECHREELSRAWDLLFFGF